MGPAITISDLTFRHSESSRPVFRSFGMDIPPGACCALLGPAGAGKTTLLEILSGAAGSQYKTARAGGTVRIGSEIYSPISSQVLFPAVGLVLPDPYIQISGIRRTVRSEIAFTLENLGTDTIVRRQRVDEMLSKLGLTALADRDPRTLSGGEMQRVALASLLVARPPVLLLDESANALDTQAAGMLSAILHDLKGSTTTILTDYTADFALGVADRFIVLHEGSIRYQGDREGLIAAADTLGDFIPPPAPARAL